MNIIKGVYWGVRKRLKGKTALLQRNAGSSNRYLAQFDDRSEPEAYNWHEFPESDFYVVEMI